MNDITLKGITWDHPRGYEPLVASSNKYYEITGIKVNWEIRSLKDFGDQSLVDLARKFDLLINDHPHSGVAAQSRCVLALEEYVDPHTFTHLQLQSAGPSFESYHYQGHQWALPIDAAFQSACYRPDLMDVPVPTGWQDVFDLADRLKRKNKFVGMALCPTDCLCTFLSLTAQFGAPIRDASELVNLKTGTEVLELMRRMREEFYAESLNWNPIQLYDHMAEHDEIVYTPLAFNYTNYSREGFRKNSLVYSNAPGITSVLGGAGIAVSSTCKNKQEAADFASWICSKHVQKGIYTQAQGQPGNIKAWEDPLANSLTSDFFINTRNSLDHAYVRPRFLNWPVFQEYLGNTIHRLLKEEEDIPSTLYHLNDAYEEIKHRVGRSKKAFF
ncbi:extracellular solute-binding protein [Fulvivirga sp. M361]|uniref:ABC transporter substrate-binding protein n=1 Tax=Fulvivirga sp. M361 TaxID=2594266 RepID=UPI00117A612C|nr:extracellular solute-binding protein [Fulvivirga sp. M361]TRX50030.1 extracellular solute-binding protein [Fulvivirga sp. M361]